MNPLLLAGGSAAAIMAAGATLGSSFLVHYLAQEDVMFTEVVEGTAKAVMKGQSFHRFLISLNDGRYPNDPFAPWYDPTIPRWEILEGEPDVVHDNRLRILKETGTFFIGIPFLRNIKRYGFRWSEEITDGATNKEIIKARTADTDFLYLTDFPYEITLSGAETSEGISCDVQYTLILRITNPQKALFGTENWLTVIKKIVNSQARDYVGSRTYDDLKSQSNTKKRAAGTSQDNPDDFSCPIVELTDELPTDRAGLSKYQKGFLGRYGVTIVSANIQTIEVVGEGAAAIVASTTRAYTAKQDADSLVIEAKGAYEAAILKGGADAKVANMMAKANARATLWRLYALKKAGNLAPLMLQTEAISSPGPNRTVVLSLGNNPAVNAIPGLAGGLQEMGITTMEELEALIRQVMTTPIEEGKAA